MVLFENTLISIDIFKEHFICNLPICLGRCCVEGDFGAPVDKDEIPKIKESLEEIKHYMTPKGLDLLEKSGFYESDPYGEFVTTCVDNEDCVFAYKKNGVYACAIESAWAEGKIPFQKPISCHLYPIRLGKVKDMVSINYNEWSICKPAIKLGKKEAVPLFVFLKDALVRKFGEAWYKEIEHIARELEEMD